MARPIGVYTHCANMGRCKCVYGGGGAFEKKGEKLSMCLLIN